MSTRRGFTLIELALVVAIIGTIVAIAAARLGHSRQRYAMTSAYSSLSAMDRAAEMYLGDFQTLPSDKTQGVYPTEFALYLSKKTFGTKPPLSNALWDWNGSNASPWNTSGCNFSIWINPRPTGLWEEFDRQHDDGNLSTGVLRLLNGNKNYCLVRQQ
ncbi:MAG: type II secretion system protein [Phycisphaerales bacterium]